MSQAVETRVHCLGCGKATDPLRAGHVAILDGQFRYFCNATCKAAYVAGAPSSPSGRGIDRSLDRTADPPRVELRPSPLPSPVSSRGTFASAVTAAPPPVVERSAPPSTRAPMRSTLPEVVPVAPAAAESVPVDLDDEDEGDVESGLRARDSLPEVEARPAPRSESAPELPEDPPSRPTMRSKAAASVPDPFEITETAPSPGVVPKSKSVPPVARASTPPPPSVRDRERERDEEPYLSPSIDYVGLDEEPVSLPAPLTLRSGAGEERAPSSQGKSRSTTVTVWLPLAIVGFGVAALAVALAGFPEASIRTGLALAAATFTIPWLLRKPRALGEELPFVSAAPAFGLVAVAAAATALHSEHAGAIASTAGVAFAVTVLAQLAVLRFETDVRAHTSDIAAAIDAEARRAPGMGANGAATEAARVSPADLRLGDRVVVSEGETLVVDGVVVSGEADVSPWAFATGEAHKREGDAVLAGLRVLSGELVVAATAVGKDRLAAKPFAARETSGLFGLVRVWTPRALPLVCALVFAAELASNAPWILVFAAAFAAGASLSVVGVLATLTLATTRANQDALDAGIAFRDARALEVAGMSDVAVLCSRGTVLMGEPEVIAVEATASSDRKRVLALAAGAESSRQTPAGKALLGAARAEGTSPESLRSVLVHEGLGVTALLPNGEPVVVGSRAHLLKERVSVAAREDRVRELEAQGATVMLVAVSGKLAGLVALQDALRPGARAAIQRLLDARVEPVLVSGETREACETLARALDIEHVRPEVLPQDRAEEVRALGEGGHVVAVLGRVPSDEPALGAADVSIALGSIGLSGEFSVVLASDDVRSAAHALSIARQLRERVRLGLGLALAPTLIAVMGLGFGVMPLVLAPVAGLVAAVLGTMSVRRPSSD
jgi:cation transport ATPase